MGGMEGRLVRGRAKSPTPVATNKVHQRKAEGRSLVEPLHNLELQAANNDEAANDAATLSDLLVNGNTTSLVARPPSGSGPLPVSISLTVTVRRGQQCSTSASIFFYPRSAHWSRASRCSGPLQH